MNKIDIHPLYWRHCWGWDSWDTAGWACPSSEKHGEDGRLAFVTQWSQNDLHSLHVHWHRRIHSFQTSRASQGKDSSTHCLVWWNDHLQKKSNFMRWRYTKHHSCYWSFWNGRRNIYAISVHFFSFDQFPLFNQIVGGWTFQLLEDEICRSSQAVPAVITAEYWQYKCKYWWLLMNC